MLLKTRVTLGVVTVGAAIGAALVPATTAMAATPSLTVTVNTNPNATNLNAQSGGTVTAVGSGYTPGAQIALVQCSSVVADGSGCDQTPANARLLVADANGGFTVNNLVVTTGTKGNVQVSPRTGIKNGTALSVVGANYTPGATVYVSECTSTVPADALQKCDINSVETFTADANGAFTGTYHKVHINPQVAAGPFACAPTKQCVVAGSDSIANPGAGHIGGALVTFAALTKTVTTAKAPSSVAKNVKFAVKGKVTAAGTGVAGLKVTLFKVTKSGLNKIASKTTGSTGGYKFGGLTQKKTSKYETKTAANLAKYTAASHSKVVKVTT